MLLHVVAVVVSVVYTAAFVAVYSYFFFSFFITIFKVVEFVFATALVHVLMFSLSLFLL